MLSPLDYLNVCVRQTLLSVVLQDVFEPTNISNNLPSHFCPADRRGFVISLSANVDDVVLDLPRTEFASTFDLVASNWVGGFQVETRLKETFKNRDPWSILTVMKRESEETAGLQNAMGFAPSSGK